ncbi:MAG: SET domain-containing protein-lysine N-methyltransferase [bacterium]|nr:SET domain-containing protein-lysine N-methyltransferase [bacterium]
MTESTSPVAHPAVDDPACRVAIVEQEGSLVRQQGLVAATDLPVGAAVLYINGAVQDYATRYSVQIGIDSHVDCTPDVVGQEGATINARYPWRLLNHSCDANCVLHHRVLVAVRPIRAGEPVTFDYDTNEWQMSDPFDCCCGAPMCRGRIRGFSFLSQASRQRLAKLLSPHVVALANARRCS